MSRSIYIFSICFFTICMTANAQIKYHNLSSEDDRFSNQISNEFMPVIGVWVWGEQDLEPDGYKQSIDQLSQNSPFNLVVPFLRFPNKEVVDEKIYNQVKLAAEYAVENNIGLLPDLDVRSARRAFRKAHPDELQEMLRIKEVTLNEESEMQVSITSIKNMSDHYTGGKIPDYDALKSSLLKVYAYDDTPDGIDPKTLKDITKDCEIVFATNDSMRVSIPKFSRKGLTKASVMVSFTLFYPDVFAPHLLDFQRDILEQYKNVPLAGACKDEWGFPPYFPRYQDGGTYDYWYSKHRAEAYAKRTGGRELLEDCLLMSVGIAGKQSERQMAVNHFEEMSLHRNAEIENSFYHDVKEIFGSDAAVTVHATWWPYPDKQEMRKNGLVWWSARRDWAQTDEITPFGARTAISKKWDSPLWYNMYYTMKLSDQVWSSALAGGRINYLGYQSLFYKDIMRAETRIRLLNYISETPLDCQVAVIFGHQAAKNWAGPHFNDVGMSLVDTLWYSGYPADLIPTNEIENGSLKVDEEGWITYGDQRYSAVVLYHPEFEKKSTPEFFRKADKGQTALFRIGDWTIDFNGKKIDGNEQFPENMVEVQDYKKAYLGMRNVLNNRNIEKQTPATAILDSSYFRLRDFSSTSYFPPTTGSSRLIDGTRIIIAGTNKVSGDPINESFKIDEHKISIDAVGVAGVRLDDNGKLEALAASDLKRFQGGDLTIELDNRLDMALWKDEEGKWEGVIQAEKGVGVPEELLEITDNWTHLLLPVPPFN